MPQIKNLRLSDLAIEVDATVGLTPRDGVKL